MKIKIILIITLLVAGISTQSAAATPNATTTIDAIEDAMLYQTNPNTNYGEVPFLYVGLTGASIYRSLILFDVSAYEGISVATLEFSVSGIQGAGCGINIHIVTNSWVESTATWNFPPTYDTAVNATIASASIITGYGNSVDITKLAQDWESGKVTNYGIILEDDDGPDNIDIESSEASNPPLLHLTYTTMSEQINLLYIPLIALIPFVVFMKKRKA